MSDVLPPFAKTVTDNIFKCIFVNEKFCISIKISLRFVPEGQKPTIGLDNGLMANRRQAIIWTNAGMIHWHIYAALGGDELTLSACGQNDSQVTDNSFKGEKFS